MSKKIVAAIEANKEICQLIELAWKRWVPEQRRSYIRGLFLTESSTTDAYKEAQFLMELCKHYG
jgi:hypothetical protein